MDSEVTCPNCELVNFDVIKVLRVGTTGYRRRRVCRMCGCRWTSTELVDAGTVWLPGMPVPTGVHITPKGSTRIPQVKVPGGPRGLPVYPSKVEKPPKGSTGIPLQASGGVGGGLPSGLRLISGSDLDPISVADPIRARARSAPRANETAAFLAFYAAYPRKEKRPAACKAWRARGCEEQAEKVMAGLRRWLPEFARRDADKIPHPATWLNGEQWNDQPPVAAKRAAGGFTPSEVPT